MKIGFIGAGKVGFSLGKYLQNGGQGWIRTIVAYGDGFTVRSL